MLKEYKTKIIVCVVLFVLMLILFLFYYMLKPTVRLTQKKESSTVKTEKIIWTELKKEIKIKPKFYSSVKTEVNEVKQNEETDNYVNHGQDSAICYMAKTDTTFLLNDTTGKLRAVVGINTSFNSNIPLSKKSFFDIKYNLKTFEYDTDEKQIIKEINEITATNIFDNFGLGLFAGGIYTKDKTLSYGIGFGIIYKLTK